MRYEINFFIKNNPFLRIVVPFIIGILFQDIFLLPNIICLIACIICLLAYIVLQKLSLDIRIYAAYWNGVFLSAYIFFVACFVHLQKQQKLQKPHFYNNKTKVIDGMVLSLNDEFIATAKTYRTQAIINSVYEDNKTKTQSGYCNLTILKDTNLMPFNSYKNYDILVKKTPILITTSKSPSNFDIRAYYNRKNVYHQLFITSKDFIIIDSLDKSLLKLALIKTRETILSLIQKYIFDKNVYGLLEALLIGYKNDLHKEILNDYIQSGTVHIIAISGLHLGCIYWFLSVCLFSFLKKNLIQRLFKLFLVLIFLWFYSVLAGANASILRAAFMFSIIAFGNFVNKKTSLLNLLSASALFILFVDSNQLYDIGFVFSYVAVLSLHLFSDVFSNIWIPQNKALKEVKNIVTASIAAQILLLPILIYLNHSFPTYFLLNNLVTIPLSTLILAITFALLVFSYFAPLATFIATVLNSLVVFMNNFVAWSNQLPSATFLFPNFDAPQIVFYFAALIALVLAIKTRHKFIFILILCCVCISINLYNAVNEHKRLQQKIFVVYAIPNKSIVSIINSDSIQFYTDSAWTQKEFIQHLQASIFVYGTKQKLKPKPLQNIAWTFGNKKIVYLNNPLYNLHEPFVCDYLIINKQCLQTLKEKQKYLMYKTLVIDNSCNDYNFKKVFKDTFSLAQNKPNIYFINKDGVLVIR